jgi:small conductance mechanosensitive channel
MNKVIEDYGRLTLEWLRASGVKVAFILAGAFVLIRGLYLVINRIKMIADDGDPTYQSEREKRAATLSVILKQVATILIGGVAFMMTLREFKVDIAPIIAGAGIIGLAVGFGAQSLVKDVITGFFILMENQFDVGDVISGAGVSGAVEQMNLRFTRLRDIHGRVHFIPNGEFRVVSNHTRGWSQALVDIGVAYKEDVDRVEDALARIGEELKADAEFGVLMTEPMEILGVETFGDSSVTIRLLFKTMPGKQWPVAREFRKRVKRRFDELGIEIPFPQRVIYTRPLSADGEVAEGRSPRPGGPESSPRAGRRAAAGGGQPRPSDLD